MELGAFSISLAVKDLVASKIFYQKLGFQVVGGVEEEYWLILRNGANTIGLFQDMFEKNILTFNPGWDQYANKLESFTDVRRLQQELKQQGLELSDEADESTAGQASFTIIDPDGNTILIDQHV